MLEVLIYIVISLSGTGAKAITNSACYHMYFSFYS